jgi:hypothetical protein
MKVKFKSLQTILRKYCLLTAIRTVYKIAKNYQSFDFKNDVHLMELNGVDTGYINLFQYSSGSICFKETYFHSLENALNCSEFYQALHLRVIQSYPT